MKTDYSSHRGDKLFNIVANVQETLEQCITVKKFGEVTSYLTKSKRATTLPGTANKDCGTLE